LTFDPMMQAGGPGFVIFRSASIFECHRAPGMPKAELTVGSRFHLSPLLKGVHSLKHFFVLSINRKHMRLYRYSNGTCHEVEWPAGVPFSFNETEGAEGANIENRSSTGVSPGAMWSVQFGSKGRPKREGAGNHFHHFFAAIDHGLSPLLRDQPLVLTGVADEVSAYRKISKYPRILEEGILGSQQHTSMPELAKTCSEIAEREYFARSLAVCNEFRTTTGPTASGPQGVLKAALNGRIHKLCVREDSGSEDMVNSAVAETLHAGGEVFVARRADLATEVAVALLRF
jgi:Bacterial archaeo-eukaryotic release factor family 3